ncbi:MAG: phenylalanine 4-monooxygenase [Gammaproteobacteria bacterium]|nr:phenylalanine 4-monooxygenase [Gammaproteobacteria bacterium]
MAAVSSYIAKAPDSEGRIHYSEQEHATWATLYARQELAVQNRACDEYLQALERLALPKDRIPQCAELSERLQDFSGWSITPVPALISFEKFFRLLANRTFPAASFIRRPEDLDYLEEPDIFHEIFGHVPLLTDPRFAAFSEAYGKAGMAADKADHAMLARLYWFTVEFGQIRQSAGLRVYGAGIVSSPGECVYALENEWPQHKPFDPIDMLRTPYRIDIYQTVYFVLDSFEQLFKLANTDLAALVREAKSLGMHPPSYPAKAS